MLSPAPPGSLPILPASGPQVAHCHQAASEAANGAPWALVSRFRARPAAVPRLAALRGAVGACARQAVAKMTPIACPWP